MAESAEQYLIAKDTLTDIADAYRKRQGKLDKTTIAQMIADLNKDHWIKRQDAITTNEYHAQEPWERPDDWPDLDSLNLEMSGDDFIYMTYDMNKKAAAVALHIETTDKQPATIDFGHIENETYIVDETFTTGHNTNFIQWTDDYNGYVVVRVTGQ